MEVILVLLGILIGIGIGFGICLVMTRTKPSGCIRVIYSDQEEQPMLFLNSNIDIYELSKKKLVTYEVKNENYISHE